jgi:hypothetical protein
MPDDDAQPQPAAATAESPAPAEQSPIPAGKPGGSGLHIHGIRAVAALALIVLVALAIAGAEVWFQPKPKPLAPLAVNGMPTPFTSAMHKAGTTAPAEPTKPVALTSLSTTGSHRLDATFSYQELSALFNAFSYSPTSSPAQLVHISLQIDAKGVLTLMDDPQQGGTTVSATRGRVAFRNGRVIALAPFTFVTVPNLGRTAARQGTRDLVGFVNSYLAAAPGLKVESATIGPEGVHVIGTAPDRVAWP